jgi:cysteine synthase B
MLPTQDLHLQAIALEKYIGRTPLFPLQKIYSRKGVKLFAKLEWQQLGGSVKSRPAYQIIRQAIMDGHLDRSKTLLDATSGNTGIAYAAIASALGVKVALCLPENASKERKAILKTFGVDLILTSPFEGTDGAQYEAKELFRKHPEQYFYADQYANDNNWKAHYYGTADEIYRQTQGKVTHFVAGLGTSGTMMGTGKRLRELVPGIKLVALQPDAPMHGLEGWKHMETAVNPRFYDAAFPDVQQKIDTVEAWEMITKLARTEGLLVSPSAAANLLGAIRVADTLEEGVVVTTFADNADKYSEVLLNI